jgi:hypothetical protein
MRVPISDDRKCAEVGVGIGLWVGAAKRHACKRVARSHGLPGTQEERTSAEDESNV